MGLGESSDEVRARKSPNLKAKHGVRLEINFGGPKEKGSQFKAIYAHLSDSIYRHDVL
jgi:hypothetical protein